MNVTLFGNKVFVDIIMLKLSLIALAGVAQWIEYQLANQRVTGLIPSQGTCLNCRPGLQ